MGFSISNEEDDVREDFDGEEIIGDSTEGDEITDEQIVDENLGEEAVEESTEEPEEDENLYEFEVPGESGVDKVTLSDKELKTLLELRDANSVDVNEINDLRRIRPVVDGLLRSDGAKRFLDYHSKGYDDTRIIEGMFLEKFPWAKEALEGYIRQQNEQQAASSAPPEFEDIGSEISWHVQNALKKTGILSTFEQQQQQQNMMREQQAEQQLLAENDKVFYQVLSEFNIDKLTNEELEELGRGFQEVYPGTMFNKHLITPTQVRVVYNHTLGRQSRQPARQFNVRQGKLPNVLPAGNGGGRIIATPEPNRDSRGKFAAKERSARIKEFFES